MTFKNSSFSRLGCCEVIISDQGREFVNAILQELFQCTETTKFQTNGFTERFNQMLQASLIKLVNSNQNNWDEHPSAIIFAYRTSVLNATKLPPFEAM